MNKFCLIVFFCLLLSKGSFAHVDLIDISKITADSKLIGQYNFIKDNRKYYISFVPEWKFDKTKDELTTELKAAYTSFAGIKRKNAELYLLLGDISHYLYNMDVSEYFKIAVTNYQLAAREDPKDVRAPWFLGYHYALANVPVEAAAQFETAKKLPFGQWAVAFWNAYGYMAVLADMPSTALHAMKRAREINGSAGGLESNFGNSVSQRFVNLDKDKEYKSTDLWIAGSKTGTVTFRSRPLGLKIPFDSLSKFSAYDYKGRKAAFMIMPPRLKSKSGKEIGYSILVVIQIAKEGETLEDFMESIVKGRPNRKKVELSGKYDKTIAYEMLNKDVYPQWGGSHGYIVGIERDDPETPGLLLEEAIAPSPRKPGETQVIGGTKLPSRFSGRILYSVLLDSCEEIHDESLSLFKTFLGNQLVIE